MKIVDNFNTRIKDEESAVRVICDDWDRQRMHEFKEAKVLFLDQDSRTKGVATIPFKTSSVRFSEQPFDYDVVFKHAKKSKIASVVIAENYSDKDHNPVSAERLVQSHALYEKAQSYGVGLKGHILIQDAYFTASWHQPLRWTGATLAWDDEGLLYAPLKQKNDEIIEIPKVKIKESTDSFPVFVKNWDDDRLENFKEAKALLLNNKNEAFALLDVRMDGLNIPKMSDEKSIPDMLYLFSMASAHDAKKIILAENNLSDLGGFDKRTIDVWRAMKKEATSSRDVKATDYLMIQGNGYCSARENQRFLKQAVLN